MKVALDLWAGTASYESFSQAQLEDIKRDPDVQAVYPQVIMV